MNSTSPFVIFNAAFSFLWFGVAIFKLVVAIIAMNKHKIPATTLMLIGAILSIGGTIGSQLFSMIGYFDYLEAFQVIMGVSNLLATLLFVVGILQLVYHLTSRVPQEL